MKKPDFINLIEKHLNGEANSTEENTLLKCYDLLQKEELSWDAEAMGDQQEVENIILGNISAEISLHEKVKQKKSFPFLSVAASIAILICFGLFFLKQNTGEKHLSEIKPGQNKAFLVLSDGRKISLTDSGNGKIAEQSGIEIIKTTEGKLIYSISEDANIPSDADPIYNTIITPRGGDYEINLPDGTMVYLNSASSLKYPIKFAANERKVELGGEGYFEVSKDRNRPFKVITRNQQIEVLGTHFNVNAYEDEEDIRTTLLEGSVKVSVANRPDHARTLKPGQQSQLKNQVLKVDNVDVEAVVAWKTGSFVFENEKMEIAMRRIARWYDIEVVYDGNFDNIVFVGSFSKFGNLKDMLKVIEATNKFKCKIEGRRLKIMK